VLHHTHIPTHLSLIPPSAASDDSRTEASAPPSPPDGDLRVYHRQWAIALAVPEGRHVRLGDVRDDPHALHQVPAPPQSASRVAAVGPLP
jgi:hypothetical protein